MSMSELKQSFQQLAGLVNVANALCTADGMWDQATQNDPSNGEFSDHVKTNLESVVKAMQANLSRLSASFERGKSRVHTN
jgi:hypothetical protein